MKAEPRKRLLDRSSTTADPSANLVARILEVIGSVRFGSVEIVIHDARVVQIERKEKFRFDKPAED